jgi:hypothetical protein
VWLDGADVTRLSPERRGIGFVYQRSHLFPHLSVLENVAYGLRYHGLHGREAAERVEQMADLLHIRPLLDRRVDGLSGGTFDNDGLLRLDSGTLVTTNSETRIGTSTGGSLTVNGGTWLAKAVALGSLTNGNGTLTINGGNVTLSDQLRIAAAGSSTGAVNITGGQLTVTNGAINVGLAGPGQLNLSGGTVLAQQLLATNGAKSDINFNGGTLVSQSTTVSTGQNFLIGDTGGNAVFKAVGGAHQLMGFLPCSKGKFADGMAYSGSWNHTYHDLDPTGLTCDGQTLKGTLKFTMNNTNIIGTLRNLYITRVFYSTAICHRMHK